MADRAGERSGRTLAEAGWGPPRDLMRVSVRDGQMLTLPKVRVALGTNVTVKYLL